MMRAPVFRNLGLVPAESRTVKPMPKAVLEIVPPPVDNTLTLKKSDPDVEQDTMPLIIKKIKRTLSHTSKLADKLKGASLHETVLADSKFLLTYIKYVKDDPDNEQIRSPRRTIYEGKGDCDCMATLIGSLLANQGIAFKLRIAKYKNRSEWSHIYVVVPKSQSLSKKLTNRDDYYVIDPVTNKVDYEAPKTDFKDYTMGLQYLDGLGKGVGHLGCADSKCGCDKTPTIDKLRRFVPAYQVVADGKVPTEVFLQDKNIPYTDGVENNQGFFVINTVNGAMQLPTIMTKDEATAVNALAVKDKVAPTREEKYLKLKAVEADFRAPSNSLIEKATQAADAITTAAKDAAAKATAAAASGDSNWFWLLVAAGGVALLWPKGKKKEAPTGLSGVPPTPKAKKKSVPTFKM